MSKETFSSSLDLWKCACGKVQIELHGPPMDEMICHCKSCVTVAKHIDEQRRQKTGNNYDAECSILESTARRDEVGACCAVYAASQVRGFQQPEEDDSSSLLQYVKLGARGPAVRSFTTCCRTQVTNFVHPKLIVLNRNVIVRVPQKDSLPTTTQLAHFQTMNALDPDQVPQPRYNTESWWFTLIMEGWTRNPFASTLSCPALLPKDDNDDSQSNVLVIPKPWED